MQNTMESTAHSWTNTTSPRRNGYTCDCATYAANNLSNVNGTGCIAGSNICPSCAPNNKTYCECVESAECAASGHGKSVHISLSWIIFGVVGLLIVGFSAWFIQHFKLKDEPSGVTGLVGFFSLLFGLLSLFLIPADVYMCSAYGDHPEYRNDAKLVYYSFYSVFLFCLFVALPFGYFYYEELGDLEDRSHTFCQKAGAALKYTACTAVLWVTLIVVGLFVSFNSRASTSTDEWTHKIADSFSQNVDGIMPFCMAVVTALGMLLSTVYTAYGLAAFPLWLLRPMEGPSQDEDPKHLQIELRKVSQSLDMLETKYRGRDTWPARDKAKRNALQRKKKALEMKKESISSSGGYGGESCCSKIARCFWTATAPVRYAVAIVAEGFSVVLVVSIMLHLIDQGVHSSCGYSCGFALNDPKLARYDPVSFVMTECASYFPLDYIFFAAIIFWIFWTTIWALMRIDVRCLCLKLFSLRAHETMHNALMMAIAFLLLILTSFNYLMYSLATQYMTFGNQGSDCSIVCAASDTDCKECEGTEIYYLLSGIAIGMPIFGLVYYALSCVFVLVFFAALVFNLCSKPKKGGDRLLRRASDDDLEAIFRE